MFKPGDIIYFPDHPELGRGIIIGKRHIKSIRNYSNAWTLKMYNDEYESWDTEDKFVIDPISLTPLFQAMRENDEQ